MVPAVIWTILILIACTWPGKDIPDAPVTGFDKIVHFGLLFVWAILWATYKKSNLIWVCILGISYGIGLEFYQQLLPFDRTFDWYDALADAVGVIVGLVFYKLILHNYLQRLY
tara:strand:+ start:421 stop:759 length:339 start_codon:yes stop_codon:yes gene_type:complete